VHSLGSIPGRGRGRDYFANASRPSLGPTQSPIRWVTGSLSPGVKRSVYLVPRLRMRGAIPLLPHTSSWRGVRLSTGIALLPFTLASLTNPLMQLMKHTAVVEAEGTS
jgi:hypothetical protein